MEGLDFYSKDIQEYSIIFWVIFKNNMNSLKKKNSVKISKNF